MHGRNSIGFAFNSFSALGLLRSAFHLSLINFCERKHVPSKFDPVMYHCHLLWKAIAENQAAIFPADQAPVSSIEPEKEWLFGNLQHSAVAALTAADLDRILNCVHQWFLKIDLCAQRCH